MLFSGLALTLGTPQTSNTRQTEEEQLTPQSSRGWDWEGKGHSKVVITKELRQALHKGGPSGAHLRSEFATRVGRSEETGYVTILKQPQR